MRFFSSRVYWKEARAVLIFVTLTVFARAQQVSPQVSPDRESLEDAWWTGPLLAPSAATLPHGHFLLEPYLYDVIVQGRYDADGNRRSAPHSNGFRSLTYIVYGLTDRLTLGMIPTAGYNLVSGSPNSSAPGLGDLTLKAEYLVRQFHKGNGLSMASLTVQETLPTGKYDHLGTRPSDGLGSGAYTTTLAVYLQKYFWLPNGRILRARFNVSQAFSKNVNVEGVSVYGTSAGFRGHAHPGNSTFVDAAAEYSLTRNWVFALDLTYQYNGNTHVAGSDVLQFRPNIQSDLGSSTAFGLAPAVEYNWKRNIGVIFGVYVIPAGRNTSATITPAIAINFLH